MRNGILMPIVALLAAAALLFAASLGLADVKAAREEAELLEKMQTILPGSTTFTYEEYTGEDANIRCTYKAENGYVVLTETAGYAGPIEMLIGVSNDGTVTGLQVRDMEETWGLGTQALTNWEYLIQYLNTDGAAEVGTDIDALTGATVTSKAVTRSVNSAVAFVTGADASSGATEWGG